jgi:RNA polymerase sigma-70 factor, ECF subfamily
MAEAVVDEPDPQVVQAARSGDLRAFEALVRRYQGDVWRLSFHLVRDDSLADDITQDTFMRVFRFMRRYRADSKFSTWLFSIARNCAMDELRRSARRARLRGRVEAETQGYVRGEHTGVEVRDVLAQLPLGLREPVVMIDMFGMSYREVAEILAVPEGTIKSRVHRAREQLASQLSPPGEQENEG